MKLSAYCKICKDTLDAGAMERWVSMCERSGKDPLTAKDGAILCSVCLWQALLGLLGEDEPEEAEGTA